MDVDVRDQDMEKLFVTEKLAFSVATDLVTDDTEDEIKELCRILAAIHEQTNWAATRDLLHDINGSLQIYDDHTGRTL